MAAGLIRNTEGRIRSLLERMSTTTLWILGILVVSMTGLGGVVVYQAYDYVQYDSEFCLSCHLMERPFELFANSVHQGVSCKACHQPNPIERARMGLRQIVDHPEEIREHAEVPNATCGHCHVEGDREKWIIMTRSRGHEMHLNSREPVLRDIECVTCHSESVHGFEATVQSCAASQCHDDTRPHLGRMAELDLSCVVCHDFRAPVDDDAPRGEDPASLRPGPDQCLTCHIMRDHVEIDPEEDPHGAECGTCHDAHTQRRAREALRSCQESDCHALPETIEDEHHQWESIRLFDCTKCHEPHRWRVDGEDCTACHADLLQPS